MEGGSFRGAKLYGANFEFVQIDKCKVSGALYDENTVWPSGYDPELHGAVRKGSRKWG